MIEFGFPADIDVTRKVEEKVATFGPLIRDLQVIYKDFHCKILLFVIGALGTISKATKENLRERKF